MNNFNIFVVLSVIAVASMFGGSLGTSVVFAQDNMTMGMDNNMSMPMDHNMTMSMDNSSSMMDNSTMQ